MVLAAASPWYDAWWAWLRSQPYEAWWTWLRGQPFWVGPGWTAVAALAQIAAAIATLTTLWFFWLQLRGIRQQARRDFELSHTPLLSITFGQVQSEQNGLRIPFTVGADGQGVAYNATVTIFEVPANRNRLASPQVIRYLRAPHEAEGSVFWIDPELMSGADRTRDREIQVEVAYTNPFNRVIRFRHRALLNRQRGVRITDGPTYLDLAGHRVERGGARSRGRPVPAGRPASPWA